MQNLLYIAGGGAHGYLDMRPFEVRQIRVEFQSYQHPVYPQMFEAFEPNLSVLDLLFNCGDQSLDIIRGLKADGQYNHVKFFILVASSPVYIGQF